MTKPTPPTQLNNPEYLPMPKKKGPDELKFSSQCFTLSFDVYPPITMVRENALKLAMDLAAHQELTDIHMSDESWTFRRPQAKGHSRGRVEVNVQEQEVTIEQRAPTGALERFELLVDQSLASFGAVFTPEAIWGSVISLEYLVDIGSDARQTILGNLDMLENEDEEGDGGKLGVFQRPCHFVGLRLGFPAFEVEDEPKTGEPAKEEKKAASSEGEAVEKKPEIKGIDWQATLTLQSLIDNPQALSVEVNGRWIGAVPWNEVNKQVSSRVRIVDEFLKTKTKEFLQQFRSEE